MTLDSRWYVYNVMLTVMRAFSVDHGSSNRVSKTCKTVSASPLSKKELGREGSTWARGGSRFSTKKLPSQEEAAPCAGDGRNVGALAVLSSKKAAVVGSSSAQGQHQQGRQDGAGVGGEAALSHSLLLSLLTCISRAIKNCVLGIIRALPSLKGITTYLYCNFRLIDQAS
ncbi:hypothetical protein NL676_020626 [Syzygium grande]|nr:hypothetical protein NL676_020626 [Syzygium grande]